jgi:hypothetical protein
VRRTLNPGREGQSVTLDLSRTRYLSTSSLWSLGGTAVRRDARDASESYWQGEMSVGRLFQAPLASLLYVETRYGERRFDGSAAAFGVTRRDQEFSLQARVSKRDLLLFGAHPYVQMTLSRSRSNIDLYSYDRNRVEFGLTREF